MLVATIVAILFLGGGSAWFGEEISQLKKDVKEVTVAGEQRDAALDIVKEMKNLAKDQGRIAKERTADMTELLQNRTVPDAELDVVLADYGSQAKLFYGVLTDKRFRLRDTMSREQWAEMYGDE